MIQFKVWVWRCSLIVLCFVKLATVIIQLVAHTANVICEVISDLMFRYEANMKSSPKGSFVNDPRLKTVKEFFIESWNETPTSNYDRYKEYNEKNKQ